MHESFRLDTLVELQDQYSNVYPLSPTGARGWVRARRELPKIDPEVFIEWDKSHWRYHGENDGWTYEHHFREVVDAIPAEPEIDSQFTDETNRLLKQAAEYLRHPQRLTPLAVPEVLSDAPCPHCGGFHENSQEAFLQTLLGAQEAAVDSEGYFIMLVRPRDEDGVIIYEPEIYCDALTDTAQSALEAQVVHVSAQLFARHLRQQVGGIEDGPDGPGR